MGAGFSHDSVQPLFVWRQSLLNPSRAEQVQSNPSVVQSPGELLQSCSLPSPSTGIWLFLVSLFYLPVPNAVESLWFPQGGFPGVFSYRGRHHLAAPHPSHLCTVGTSGLQDSSEIRIPSSAVETPLWCSHAL